MDTTDSAIFFDDAGVCDHCLTFRKKIEPAWRSNEIDVASRDALIAKIKTAGKSKEYDCIIGLSGGIDSSYLTYLAKVEFGLKPLVFHVDAGWNSQEAVNNIEKLVDALELDLFTYVVDWEEMRDLQLAFFKSGVPHIDTPQDHAFFATMYKYSVDNNVSYILTGGNYSTECVRNPLEWMYYQSDIIQLRDIHAKFGKRPLLTFPTTSILRHKVYLPFVRGIRTVRLLDHAPYSKADAVKLLVEKLGWQPYPQKHFESRFTRFYESYWLPTRFGYDTRKVQFSSLILTGQMSREEALRQLETPAYDPKTIAHDIEYVATKLGISSDELMSYHALPKKTFRDYKSQEMIYAFGAPVMRLLGLERGGKR